MGTLRSRLHCCGGGLQNEVRNCPPSRRVVWPLAGVVVSLSDSNVLENNRQTKNRQGRHIF